MNHLFVLSISAERGFCSYRLVELRKEEKETVAIVSATGKTKQLAKCALFYMHTDNIWVDGHTVPVYKYLSVCKESIRLYCPMMQTVILVNITGFLICIKTIFKTNGMWEKNPLYFIRLN